MVIALLMLVELPESMSASEVDLRTLDDADDDDDDDDDADDDADDEVLPSNWEEVIPEQAEALDVKLVVASEVSATLSSSSVLSLVRCPTCFCSKHNKQMLTAQSKHRKVRGSECSSTLHIFLMLIRFSLK